MFFLPKSLLLVAFALTSQTTAAAINAAQIPFAPTASTHDPRIQKGIPLVILPLGNSITWGYGSTSGNGYREPLLNLLSPSNPVKFIGSQRAGNMSNNENEGHPGALIDQIATYADKSLYLQPNIILLMAGTNDINSNAEVITAPARLGALIDLCVSSCPNVVLLVAALTPISNSASQARADAFNDAIPGLVAARVEAGKRVLSVNMTAFVTVGELVDGLHPNDRGYEGMAEAWEEGIRDAARKGWVIKVRGTAGEAAYGTGSKIASSGVVMTRPRGTTLDFEIGRTQD